jgi:Polyketide cyclase / dehydrase and lipid transport.
MTRRSTCHKRPIDFLPITFILWSYWCLSQSTVVFGFNIVSTIKHGQRIRNYPTDSSWYSSNRVTKPKATTATATSLNIWWFGGSDTEQDDDSCELVAVRIERTSANSRRIAGSIVVPKPVDDVWAILTDYDNLAIHVPNLVESKRVNPGTTTTAGARNGMVNSNGRGGYPGDGSYRCRLFQKGAQKIVGFEFGASLTMDMTEQVLQNTARGGQGSRVFSPMATVQSLAKGGEEQKENINPFEEKKIIFRCVESQFFSEFDGEWKVTWTTDPDEPTKLASMVEYVVDVRPRGPVPVQALEWRIREDVPTNLRAVKAASIELGKAGVEALRKSQRKGRNGNVVGVVYKPISTPPPRLKAMTAGRLSSIRGVAAAGMDASSKPNWNSTNANVVAGATTATMMTRQKTKLAPVRVEWYEDETMAAYLNNRSRNKR